MNSTDSDNLIDDLETVEAMEVEGPEEVDPDNEFLELDLILQRASEETLAKATVKNLRKAAKNFQSSAEARREAEARLREWEEKLEWNSIANVALFHEQTCKCCGTTHRSFGGYLVFQTHRKTSHERRWINVQNPQPNLPKEVAFQYSTTPICPICAGGAGWDFSHINSFTLPRKEA